jgi:hypothetical protein
MRFVRLAARFLSVSVFVPSFAFAATTEIDFSIAQHVSVSKKISEADANGIVRAINEVFATNNPPCPIKFLRTKKIAVFDDSVAPGTINSESDFSALAQVSAGLRIVEEINWCGQFLAGIRGCSSQPGQIWAVVRFKPKLDPLIWAHEFAHTTGSAHRSDPFALMQPMLSASNRAVNSEECQRLVAGSQAAFDPSRALTREFQAAPFGTPSVSKDLIQGSDGFRMFIDRQWPDGIPYLNAAQFTSADVSAALTILDSGKSKEQWLNTIMFLGSVGTADLLERFGQFVRHHIPFVSSAERDAVSAVPLAIAWIGARHCRRNDKEKCESAVRMLVSMSSARWWRATKRKNANFNEQEIGRLTLKAAIALALPGSEVSELRLKQLRSALATASEESNLDQPSSVAMPGGLYQTPQSEQVVDNDTRTALQWVRGKEVLIEIQKEAVRVQNQGGLEGYYKLNENH